MDEGKTIMQTEKRVTQKAYDTNFNGKISQIGTLIMSFKLTIGRCSIVGVPSFHNEAIISIFPYDKTGIIKIYLLKVLSIIANQSVTVSAIKGNTLNSSSLDNLLIPIPPLDEQKRIVSKIENLFFQVDLIEKEQARLRELEKIFKDKILTLGMQGKLVEQNPNDEPASILLERIKLEKAKLIKEGKIKPDKVDSYIYQDTDKNYYEKIGDTVRNINDEIPFEIPESWVYLKHNDIINLIGGSQPPKSTFKSHQIDGYIQLFQIRDYGNFPQPIFIKNEDAKKITNNGDILIARYGASLGKVFLAKYGAYNVAMSKVVLNLGNEEITKEWLLLFYKSSYFQYFIKGFSRTAIDGFNYDDLDNLLFSLPPLYEQNRIVRTIESIFRLI
jgi:type I restriction enzyme S subunit